MQVELLQNTGTFLSNPDVETLKNTQQEGRVLAKTTYGVREEDSLDDLYTVCIEEYFDNNFVEVKTTSEQPQTESEIDILLAAMPKYKTEYGPLQTKITFKYNDKNEAAKQILKALAKHLEKGFYVSHPYVLIMGGYYDEPPYLVIQGIAPLFADSLWQGLQSCTSFPIPADLIDKLKALTYQRAYRANIEAIYTKIQQLIAEQKYSEAVDFAIAETNKRNEYDYLIDTKADYLYQTGIWLKDLNAAEANRAFRTLSTYDMHCLHLLARKQITLAAEQKLSDPAVYGSQATIWSTSLLHTGLSGATTPGASQDAYLKALQTMVTKDGALEMDTSMPGAAEYGHAIATGVADLRGQTFDRSSLHGTAFAGLAESLDDESAAEVAAGLAMMEVMLKGLGAAIAAAPSTQQSGSSNSSSTRPRPRG